MSERNDYKFADELLKKLGIKFQRKVWKNNKREVSDGIPDYIIPIDNGKTIWIEWKSIGKTNNLNDKQKDWQQYLITNRHDYYIVDNFYSFINILKTHGLIKED